MSPGLRGMHYCWRCKGHGCCAGEMMDSYSELELPRPGVGGGGEEERDKERRRQ